MKHILKRVTAILAAAMLLCSTAFAESTLQRRDAVSALLESVGRAAIPATEQVLRTFDDADALPEEMLADYSRAANYAIARRMGSNSLAPDAELTRAELLAMVGWAAEPKLTESGSGEAAFIDLPDWSIAPVSRLAEAGWLELYAGEDGTLGADETATQEELDYFTAKLTELYNTVTPGESFYGYVNDQWMRNRVLPDVRLDLPHGVVCDVDEKWSVMNDCQAELKAKQEAVIAGILDGSIPCEEGSAARRFRDMVEVCMQGDPVSLYTSSTEYGAEVLERIKNAESMEALLKINADIYCEAGTPALVTFNALAGVDGRDSYIFSYQLNDAVKHLSALIEYFGLDGARAGMVQYLRKAGQLFGISLSTEEAEALHAYCARVWDGQANLLFGQFKMQHLGDFLEGKLDITELQPTLAAHPEISPETLTYEEGCAPAQYMPAAEVFAACPSLHLKELMQATGFGAVENIYVFDPAQLSAAEAFFGREENLNAAKVLTMLTLCNNMICRVDEEYIRFAGESDGYVKEAADLTLETDTAFCQMNADEENAAETAEAGGETAFFGGYDEMDSAACLEEAIYMAESLMPEILGEVYAECCVDQEAISSVERMVEMIIGGYIARFENNTWMDESSRKAAIEKLNQMRYYVGFPKGKFVPEITPVSEGGTYLSNMLACKRNDLRCLAAVCTDPEYRYLYDAVKANTVAAYNVWQLNCCYIMAGMIQKPFYDPDRSFAGNLGAIGSVIAHEIGHAFDSDGAGYDAHGDENNWWTEKDAAIFEERKQEFIEYYNRAMITEYMFQNGELTLGENMSDFAGMVIIMDLLEGDADAQRDALMGFAANQAALCGASLKVNPVAQSDEHAAPNVRIDAVVSSLDAFYALYDVEEYDPMYVAPEERLKLW